jgi:hypothetical protein
MEAKDPQTATLGHGTLSTYYTQEQLQKTEYIWYLAPTALLSFHILLHYLQMFRHKHIHSLHLNSLIEVK